MKICRKCNNSVIALQRNREIHTKVTVPSMYLNCSKFGNRTCSYIKKSCDLHEQVKNDNNIANSSKKMEAIFLVGLPGSGKSTYVKELLSQNKDYKVVSMDLIREKLGICSEGRKGIGSKEQEQMVRQTEADEITSLVRDGFSIIIDDTNLRSEKRLSQVRIIKEINKDCKIKYVFVKTDVETCIQRRAGEIPANIIRMFNAPENWVITDDEKNLVDEVLEVINH